MENKMEIAIIIIGTIVMVLFVMNLPPSNEENRLEREEYAKELYPEATHIYCDPSIKNCRLHTETSMYDVDIKCEDGNCFHENYKYIGELK